MKYTDRQRDNEISFQEKNPCAMEPKSQKKRVVRSHINDDLLQTQYNREQIQENLDLRKLKGEATREKLIIEAINLFGQKGYKGTNTRALAEAAQCNLGLITFHFGGKMGLYTVAITRVKNRLTEIMAPSIECLQKSTNSQQISPKELYSIVINTIVTLSENLVGMEAIAGHALLLLRDFQDNTEDTNTTYAHVFSPLLYAIEKALDKATNYQDSAKARLYSFLIINAGLEFLRNYPVFYPKNKADPIEMPKVSHVIKVLVSKLLTDL